MKAISDNTGMDIGFSLRRRTVLAGWALSVVMLGHAPAASLRPVGEAAAATGSNLGPLIEASALRPWLGRVRILDIREPDDEAPVDAARWLAGAVSAPYSRWRGPLGEERPLPELTAWVRSLGLDAQTPVVIVGDGEEASDFGAAARVYWTLRWLGLRRLAILNGGAPAWIDAGLPLARQPATVTPSTYTPRLDASVRASLEEVRARLGDPQTLLLDARPAPFYRGALKAPAARRPGTLPGAQSFDHAQWFPDGSARLPDAATLARIAAQGPWQARAGAAPTRMVSFCNTGHWAAINWFVLSEVLGQSGVQLYPGSMVEWSRAGLPMDHVPGRAEQLWAQLRTLWRSTP